MWPISVTSGTTIYCISMYTVYVLRYISIVFFFVVNIMIFLF